MKRGKLTMQEHREYGTKFKQLNKYFITQICKVSNTYGHSKKISKIIAKCERCFMELRSEMENQCYRDYPQDANTHIYYGDIDEQAESTTRKDEG